MKGCELCGKEAKMYCESDEAILCWECDEKVHSANFLVAKHTRILLCHSCQNPTPWMASGSKLGPTLSLCHSCSNISNNDSCPDDHLDEEEEERVSTSQVEVEVEVEEEDGENQVVPWSTSPPSPPPPPVASSSSSDESGSEGGGLKRVREWNIDDTDLDDDFDDVCQDKIGLSSIFHMVGSGGGQGRINLEEGNSLDTTVRPSRKQQKTSGVQRLGQRGHQLLNGQDGSRSTAVIVDSIKRHQTQMMTNGETSSAAIMKMNTY